MSEQMRRRLERRTFVAQTTAGFAALAAGRAFAAEEPLKIAAVFTEFRYRSHAHVILENFLEPLLFNGKWTDSGVKVVSFYGYQFPAKDMTKDVARDYKVPLYKSIAEALCLGGNELAVDAVLSIGEHG